MFWFRSLVPLHLFLLCLLPLLIQHPHTLLCLSNQIPIPGKPGLDHLAATQSPKLSFSRTWLTLLVPWPLPPPPQEPSPAVFCSELLPESLFFILLHWDCTESLWWNQPGQGSTYFSGLPFQFWVIPLQVSLTLLLLSSKTSGGPVLRNTVFPPCSSEGGRHTAEYPWLREWGSFTPFNSLSPK